MTRSTIALIILAATITMASAETITGKAGVVDGDTIAVSCSKIRLEGIDAPEAGQRCKRQDGTSWPCGQLLVQKLIGPGAVRAVSSNSG
jgi:endonuclease YncB( thermonuclease family)